MYTNQEVTIHTMNGHTTNNIRQYDNVKIRGYNSVAATTINPYEQKTIPYEEGQIPVSETIKDLEHLEKLQKCLAPL